MSGDRRPEYDPRGLTHYLHSRIPLTEAMDISAVSIDRDGVRLVAPLAPNRNHQGSVFGGSIATLALTSCWALAHARIVGRDPEPALVVAEQRVRYLRPATDSVEAVSQGPAAQVWEAFSDALTQRGRARIDLQSSVTCAGRLVARFEGRFVAMVRSGHPPHEDAGRNA